MEEKCPYRHLPFMERKGPPGWNGSVRWNGKAEGKARVESEGTSEDVIIGMEVVWVVGCWLVGWLVGWVLFYCGQSGHGNFTSSEYVTACKNSGYIV